MSDDLVKRLRDDNDNRHGGTFSLAGLAADRIEELEAQIKEDALQYLSDTGQMGDTIDDLTRRHKHTLRKIEELEAKLAKAVGFAEIVERCGHGALWDLARTTLAELKGEK